MQKRTQSAINGNRAVLGAIGLAAAAALASGFAAEAAGAAAPIPGGKYAGKTKRGPAIRIQVFSKAPNGVARGIVRVPCGRVRARFATRGGSWTAVKRNRHGRVLLRVVGTFGSANRAGGRVTRVRASRRLGRRAARRCRAARFRAWLKRPARVRSKTVRYGPYVTEPGGEHGSGAPHNEFRANVPRPCADCYLVGIVPELTDADGTPANFSTQAMLHHAVFTSLGRADASCGTPERFFASGNERTPFILPRGFGYRVLPGDRWGLLTHIMNMGHEPRTLYVNVTFYYVKAPAPLKRVKPLWLDVDNCKDSEYSIPAGLSATTWDFVVPASAAGRVVAMAGHLHDDGVRIVATNETRGITICTSRAGYGRIPAYMGHIESMSGCAGNPLGRIAAGDLIRLNSVYDSPVPQNDVMGIMLAYVATG